MTVKTRATAALPVSGTASLSVTDNRTGQQYEIRIEQGAIRATALGKIKASAPQ